MGLGICLKSYKQNRQYINTIDVCNLYEVVILFARLLAVFFHHNTAEESRPSAMNNYGQRRPYSGSAVEILKH